MLVVFIVIVTYLLVLTRPGGVFTLGVRCFSGFASLLPLVFAAVFWKRATKAGACAFALTAAVSWCCLFAQADYGANRNFLLSGMTPVATILMASTFALVLVSLLTPRPSEATVEKFFAKPVTDTEHPPAAADRRAALAGELA